MARSNQLALGLDFGTESVRALLVSLEGEERGAAVARYPHGQIIDTLPGSRERLPADFALQDPADWLTSAAQAIRKALRQAGATGDDVLSIGVDFTSCTMLPTLADGAPLCQQKEWRDEPYAWPKLWKHHGAKSQTDRINAVARARHEPWLARYGGVVGLEWFFPKILETLEHAPQIYCAADVWLEAGDWFVWQLVGAPEREVPRSTCQAGYKAQWNAASGYPSSDFFRAVHRQLADIESKLPGRLLAPGEAAGELSATMARRLGLKPGAVVSAAVIDAHAGVPGAGVSGTDTLVMVLGTSSCHMLNSAVERLIPGVAGVVAGGILPGTFGYETGQAAVGDTFDWVRQLAGEKDFGRLDERAAAVPAGSNGVLCLDWLNGCRTPKMDGRLRGAFTGLTLATRPEHLYRAAIEGTACGVRWIVELLREGGVPVKKLVATGGLPHHNPLLMQIYADVLGQSIEIAPSRQGPALGAAILGLLAAGRKNSGFASAKATIAALAGPRPGVRAARLIRPQRGTRKSYDDVYRRYRDLAG